ncbi:MAG: hypothetical protein AAF596_01275 [Planctomycetota bacterium]
MLDNPCQMIPFVDEQSGKTFFICDQDYVLGPGEHDDASRRRLITMIEQGQASPLVSKEEGRARIEARLDKIAPKPA